MLSCPVSPLLLWTVRTCVFLCFARIDIVDRLCPAFNALLWDKSAIISKGCTNEPQMNLTHCVFQATGTGFSFISFLYSYKAYIYRCPGYCFLWSLSLKQIDYLRFFFFFVVDTPHHYVQANLTIFVSYLLIWIWHCPSHMTSVFQTWFWNELGSSNW